jgi:hypothetical protein
MDECDKGEEMNLMEYVSNNGEKISRIFFFFFTAAGLYFGMKNDAVLKSPNFEPKRNVYLLSNPNIDARQ